MLQSVLRLFRKDDTVLLALIDVLKEHLADQRAIEREKLEILRQQIPNQESAVPKKPDIPLPSDILMYTKQESESWAREDMEKLARQMYDEYGEWDKVREVLSAKYGR